MVKEVERSYILAQGPLMKTVDDFWLMVWQHSSPTIVMLCNCFENNMSKSWQYWPIDVGHTMVLGEDREGLELEVTIVKHICYILVIFVTLGEFGQCGGQRTFRDQELHLDRR